MRTLFIVAVPIAAVPVAAVLVAAAVSCSEASAPSPAQATVPPATAPAAASPATAEQQPPAVAGALGEALAAYQELQARLAKDDATAGSVAGKLAAAAQAATATAAAAAKQPLSDLAAAAGKLAEQMKAAPPPALDAQRGAFAEVSKALVALLVADPSLQQGRYVFECPMAPAYKKWVQTSAKLQNPYYGSKMLECGEKSTWSV